MPRIKIKSIRTAYPQIKIIEAATAQLAGRQTTSNISYGSHPIDPTFSQNESDRWWWFNRHKVFQAWDLYGTTPMPKIAVIDDGFDNTNYALDKPNYMTGYTVDCPTSTSCSTTTGNILETPNGTTSHGTSVASVIGKH